MRNTQFAMRPHYLAGNKLELVGFSFPIKNLQIFCKLLLKWHNAEKGLLLKFVFSKKATKFDEIFTVDLTLTSKCQIDGEEFVNFCALLRKYELYLISTNTSFIL